MSHAEWIVDVPAIPQPGDDIQMWDPGDLALTGVPGGKNKTINLQVESVMWVGPLERMPLSLHPTIHCREK